jgi:Ran GTPase-activating protein (RanGAP) involved in mRNA processing and transport
MIAIATVLQSNNNILQLDISNNILSTAGLSQSLLNDVMTHWALAIKVNYGIKILNLSKLGITDYIMVNLLGPAIRENRNLETLNLSSNRITRDGGVALSFALTTHPALNYLKLSCCAIQDEGACALAKLLESNTKIKEIYVDYNRITGIGLMKFAEMLEKNVMIRYIALWGNQWDQPACEVCYSNQAFTALMGGPATVIKVGQKTGTPESTGERRLKQNMVDVSFARVEGMLEVARHERKVQVTEGNERSDV